LSREQANLAELDSSGEDPNYCATILPAMKNGLGTRH
jgi:hypothetical protein